VKNALHLSILAGLFSLALGLLGVFEVYQLPAHGSDEPDGYAIEVLVREALGRTAPDLDTGVESIILNAAGLADSYAETVTGLVHVVLAGSIAFLLVSLVCFAAAFHCYRSRSQ
jgi:hypothetical protein